MALQYIASFNEKGTTIVVRTLLDDRVEQALKELCLRHNGTSAGTNLPVAATCLDGLLTAMERVGDGALMLMVICRNAWVMFRAWQGVLRQKEQNGRIKA
ncbi:hypothetical protein GBA52_002765 [Prunus armeniaca]|nr:hypothetical protein GBA52_002765 [Prunus armeniaca]